MATQKAKTYCIAYGCLNNDKNDDLSFFRLPKDIERFPTDPVINARWAEKIRLNRGDSYWKPSKITKICSVHFDNSVKYTTKGGLARLRRGAIPSKHLHINCLENHPHSHGNTHMPLTEGEEEIQGTNEDSQNGVTQKNHTFSSDDSLDSVFDSPAKAKMRRQLREKTLLQVKHRKKIRSLQQTIQRLLKNSPTTQQKTCRLKKINASLQQIILKLRKERYINNDIFLILRDHVRAAKFCNKMLKKSSSNTPVPQYSSEFRKFCVTLNFYSSKAYNYVLKTFKSGLPNAKVTYKWYRNDNGSPGLTNEAFELLKSKLQSSEKKLLWGLITDEMYLQPRNINDCDGSLDFGAGPSKNGINATEACTFVLVCLNENWKIPLGYFLVHGLTGSQKKNLINMCLTECDEVSAKVISITLAANATSVSAAQLLGCRINDPENMKTTFKHPTADHDVTLFFDHDNIQKLIRGHFKVNKLLDQDQNKLDCQFILKADECFLNHVFRGRFEYIREARHNLDYLFIHEGLADALNTCRENKKLEEFRDSEATEHFVRMMVTIFGIFFSYSEGPTLFSNSLSSANKQEVFDHLEKSKKYVLNLKSIHSRTTQCKNENSLPQKEKQVDDWELKQVVKSSIGYNGMLVNIESLKHLYLTLVEGTMETDHISTMKLRHEPLKKLFHSIRMRVREGNVIPSALEFMDGYKDELCMRMQRVPCPIQRKGISTSTEAGL